MHRNPVKSDLFQSTVDEEKKGVICESWSKEKILNKTVASCAVFLGACGAHEQSPFLQQDSSESALIGKI